MWSQIIPRKPPPTVTREQLQPGIARCCEVSLWRLREATALLDTGSAPVTAAILFSFAVEEFGKAALVLLDQHHVDSAAALKQAALAKERPQCDNW